MLPKVLINLPEGLLLLVGTAVLVASCSGPGQSARPSQPVTEGTAPGNASLAAATEGYHNYVVSEVAQLGTATRQFTGAVRAGDLDKAEQMFPRARAHYERIEPVAASFEDLDASIDARVNDVGDPAAWTGFHRIEKAMWQDKTLAGMGPMADKLDADVATLKSKVAGETYQAAQLANGAGDLLNEVSTTKVTGEEDRYSHTDLWDLAANVDGARTCFELLKPAMAAKDPDLAQRLEARFTEMAAELSKYRQGEGYVDYSAVGADQRRALANSINALAEPLSKVAGLVV